MSFISAATGGYYEGDQADPLDLAVPQRPDAMHAWDGKEWVPSPALAAAMAPKPGPRAWLERLAPASQAAIVKAAIADTSGGLLLWVLKAAGNGAPIDVTSAETQQGVAALVTAGVITAAEQATLLAPGTSPTEAQAATAAALP